MKQANLNEIFSNHQTGVLATANTQGEVDAAVFGSCRLLDDNTVVVGLGNNRTLANLKLNPYATLLFATPGPSVFKWAGARVYLKLTDLLETGSLFEETVAEVEREAGKMAARMITTVATFTITEVRPIVDFSG